jgi:hypothetical protein
LPESIRSARKRRQKYVTSGTRQGQVLVSTVPEDATIRCRETPLRRLDRRPDGGSLHHGGQPVGAGHAGP